MITCCYFILGPRKSNTVQYSMLKIKFLARSLLVFFIIFFVFITILFLFITKFRKMITDNLVDFTEFINFNLFRTSPIVSNATILYSIF